jgi:hypothetical protein
MTTHTFTRNFNSYLCYITLWYLLLFSHITLKMKYNDLMTFFLQDRWKITKGLTLNRPSYGKRYLEKL